MTVVLYSFELIGVLVLLVVVGALLDRAFGRGAYLLVWVGWFAGWLVYDTIRGDTFGKIFDLIFLALYLWLWWKIGPKDKFKRLKKAVGARTKALIAAMTDFINAGRKQRPARI